jgi:uncharacterized membrane protein YedE/YeeE
MSYSGLLRNAAAFGAGLLFGIGLVVARMTDPAKVIGFLDLAGRWDPSLALVMVGAVAVTLAGFRLAGRRDMSFLGEPLRWPKATQVDPRLLAGALAFGTGWGLAGFCPGPALASLLSAGVKPWIFVLAMLAGMSLYEVLEYARTRWRQP